MLRAKQAEEDLSIPTGPIKAGRIVRRSSGTSSLSIPTGPIKASTPGKARRIIYVFQYQQVRLKPGNGRRKGTALRYFQYQQVRLKLCNLRAEHPDKISFQYQQVRLKRSAGGRFCRHLIGFQYQQVRLKPAQRVYINRSEVTFNTRNGLTMRFPSLTSTVPKSLSIPTGPIKACKSPRAVPGGRPFNTNRSD